jgi:putative tricarboxylic transport membrane protein
MLQIAQVCEFCHWGSADRTTTNYERFVMRLHAGRGSGPKSAVHALAATLLAVVLAASGCHSSSASSSSSNSGQSSYPTEPLQLVSTMGAGGGTDLFQREMAKVLSQSKLYPQKIEISNREGGSGSVGWSWQKAQSGNPYVMTTTSVSFWTTPLQGNSGWLPTDFTPVCLLALDPEVLLVKSSSPYHTLADFIDASQNKKLSIGGVSVVSTGFVAVTQLSQLSKLQMKYVSFGSQGEADSGLLSGSLDALIANPGDVIGQLKSGDLRPLGQSGSERISGPGYDFASIPTFKELGYDDEVAGPRGAVLPPNVSDDAVKYWSDVFKKMLDDPAFKDYTASNFQQQKLICGSEFGDYVKQNLDSYRTVLQKAGVIK